MKKHKVKLSNPNSFLHEFEDGTAIGGVYLNATQAEPTELVLFLDDNEYKTLLLWLQNDDNAGMALYHFLESFTCSKWHRHIIRKTYNEVTFISIEFLS